ncbi:DUF2461 family protein [Streptomyces justiciae]|uniref:DUF2461 family protein n=1 Tax=Streptomyces justiciae TaxID=2780140 RepID=A0ABU3LVZ9_9ACTN|nr:DUF2461 family protein [Streptomyces justiciae]MDT7843406.1 DUF2461 family protein [Streptomyces justiciae]
MDIPRQFAGWDESAFDVLLRLDGEPSQEVMREIRKDRERLVRQPMVALLHDLAWEDPAFEDHSVWRYGKTPWWWQNQSAVARVARNVEIGLRFNLDGLRVQGAWWYADSDQISRFRAAVAAEASGSALDDVVAELRDKGFEITGDRLKRAPREYPTNHPRAALLRHRSLLAVRHLGSDEWLQTPEVVDRVLAAHEELRPLLTWLTTHVAACVPPATSD